MASLNKDLGPLGIEASTSVGSVSTISVKTIYLSRVRPSHVPNATRHRRIERSVCESRGRGFRHGGSCGTRCSQQGQPHTAWKSRGKTSKRACRSKLPSTWSATAMMTGCLNAQPEMTMPKSWNTWWNNMKQIYNCYIDMYCCSPWCWLQRNRNVLGQEFRQHVNCVVFSTYNIMTCVQVQAEECAHI